GLDALMRALRLGFGTLCEKGEL
ncbi:HrpE/YscL family type III secretion apparatus protein, partial [Mesorhizobium sp. M2D.F.Ca.ET.206.01.1.1]